MKSYKGSCHCGAVTYEAQIDLENAGFISCNCSRCHMLGWIMTFIPESQFSLLSGEENLTEYHFNTNKIDHLFCKTCGIESFGRGADREGNKTICINMRCIEGVDTDSLNVQKVNGKDY